MPAQIHAFLCLQDNIGVLIHDPETGACATIDAPDEEAILKALSETGWRLTDILVTHRHSDHVQGIEGLRSRTGCRVVAPGKAREAVPSADAYLREGSTVQVGSLRAQVWETPGHCADHIAYWFEADRVLFAGDTLFTLGCGRMFEGTYADFWGTLQRLATLPDDARVYCGHDYTLSNARFALAADPDNAALQARAREAEQAKAEGRFLVPTTIGQEKATNPFLRAGEPALAKAVHKEGAAPAEVFQALREWKNGF
ncbi:hydroxyacylglutathione hydrolase [Microvirga arsenatis]|uniref:Hydroxyacylglutathione hydrolase n=1 Tax=Microvirga arsenatis TaxID=2692265 RepID=A0ABW9YX73_9HYPH|nr:hydroxyacylglutathione hydrolase [Microvirga arsenatis]NBJ09705.1 hydroxyacylglutathione hydrolase [Microvirga arsenatis]NBJ23436.1 hydroxyacylglutathione hydrolase [Microvirga arsenatis]